MESTWKAVLVYTVALTLIIQAFSQVFAGPAPPPMNTVQQNVGIHFPSIDANDYFWHGHNLTAFFEVLATWLVNHTIPQPVWADTVESGLVLGTTGDWFNHTLPNEPVYIGLQMHPDNLTYDSVLVIPGVYDKDATHWQLALYWVNGTQINDDTALLVMYHMRWEPRLADPNDPQLPLGGPPD